MNGFSHLILIIILLLFLNPLLAGWCRASHVWGILRSQTWGDLSWTGRARTPGPSHLLGLGDDQGSWPPASRPGPSFQAPPASLEKAKHFCSRAEDAVVFCGGTKYICTNMHVHMYIYVHAQALHPCTHTYVRTVKHRNLNEFSRVSPVQPPLRRRHGTRPSRLPGAVARLFEIIGL